MVWTTGDPMTLILDGLAPFGVMCSVYGCRVRCVSSFWGNPLWSARFVRVVYLMVDNTTLHICSPGCFMVAPHAIQHSSRARSTPCTRLPIIQERCESRAKSLAKTSKHLAEKSGFCAAHRNVLPLYHCGS